MEPKEKIETEISVSLEQNETIDINTKKDTKIENNEDSCEFDNWHGDFGF
jgi:hypothetical protein